MDFDAEFFFKKRLSPWRTNQMNKVISYIKENGSATDAEIEQLLDIKHTRAYILTKQMCEQKLIESVGRGKTKKYLLK